MSSEQAVFVGSFERGPPRATTQTAFSGVRDAARCLDNKNAGSLMNLADRSSGGRLTFGCRTGGQQPDQPCPTAADVSFARAEPRKPRTKRQKPRPKHPEANKSGKGNYPPFSPMNALYGDSVQPGAPEITRG